MLRLAVRILYGHTGRDIDSSQIGQIDKLHNTEQLLPVHCSRAYVEYNTNHHVA